jgi:hypothetical protein
VRETVSPATVQTLEVREENVTLSPELAVADTVNGGSAAALGPGFAPNVIVWLAGEITNVPVASGAVYVVLVRVATTA